MWEYRGKDVGEGDGSERSSDFNKVANEDKIKLFQFDMVGKQTTLAVTGLRSDGVTNVN